MGIIADFLGMFSGQRVQQQAAPSAVTLAKGRGYTTDIVGESNYQDAIAAIAGPKGAEGKSVLTMAQIVFDDGNQHDSNAVGILLNGRVSGFMARKEAGAFRADILRVNPMEAPVLCYAKIVGGWRNGNDEGSYGVKLSIAKPMKLEL